jgi:hypothetical protein
VKDAAELDPIETAVIALKEILHINFSIRMSGSE